MTWLEKAQPVIILAAMLAGLALGQIPAAAHTAASFILPALTLLLTGAFLQVPLRDFHKALGYGRVVIASLLINFVWTPALAWGLGALFLGGQPEVWVGFLMLMVTPCTDWYLVFTGLSKGNLPLSTALLPLNLGLQLVLLPVYLFTLAGAVVPVPWSVLLESVTLVLVVPLGVAQAGRYLAERFTSPGWLQNLALPWVQRAQMPLLALAIGAVFASRGGALWHNPYLVLTLLLPVGLFYAANLALAWVVSRGLKSTYANFVSLSYTTLARNSPIALAIAVVAFPEAPLIALALVIGPLIELPVLALVAQLLRWVERRQFFPTGP